MASADLSSPTRTKLVVAAFVALLHVLAVLALVRAFAPEFTGRVVNEVGSILRVTVVSPRPEPSAAMAPASEPRPAERSGAAAEAGRKARPKEISAPKPKIAIATPDAAPVTGQGEDSASGARDRGEGTGAEGQGIGTGSGQGGSGQGAGGGIAVKIDGDINSARDYPRESRDLRISDYVIVALTVGTDGKVKACRVHRASRDPDADRITCKLATKRFRFRPATDAAGNPVESVFGWKQRWFYPGEE